MNWLIAPWASEIFSVRVKILLVFCAGNEMLLRYSVCGAIPSMSRGR
jgi:hypothetical protein